VSLKMFYQYPSDTYTPSSMDLLISNMLANDLCPNKAVHVLPNDMDTHFKNCDSIGSIFKELGDDATSS
jgi:hypothetical protein